MPLNVIHPVRALASGVDLRRTDSHPDHWYPIAWSEQVKAGKMLACHYAGEPVAVIRGVDGKLFALENRCAHRQVPLTTGVVKGCTVKCGYHGWAYDAAGACIDVPYLGSDRLPNGVRAYPCREVDGLIFVLFLSLRAMRGWLRVVCRLHSGPRRTDRTRLAGCTARLPRTIRFCMKICLI
jgi:nitrite reductase/ring-hydroxylating ferredoxin subunit